VGNNAIRCSGSLGYTSGYWDGRVGACGQRDLDARELIIGNANVSSVAEIWLRKKIYKLRDEFLTLKI
jgi:hypothetical protein